MTWPLDSFTIHRFRGLQGLELTGLGQVNLLVGENNSGKTSVLEALSIYCDPLNPGTWLSTSGGREVGGFGSSIGVVERLQWMFSRESTKGETSYQGMVDLTSLGALQVHEVHARCLELRGVRPVGPKAPVEGDEGGSGEEFRGLGISMEVEGEHQTHDNAFEVWEGERLRYYRRPKRPHIPARLITPYAHWMRDLPVRQFSESRLSGYREAILNLLKNFDARVSGIEVLAPSGYPVLYLQHAEAGLAPLSIFGDGMRRVLLIASILPSVEGGLLLIDEIETAIHVSALGKVFRWMLDACKQYRVQLFLTTHSLEAIDAILVADTTEEEDIVGYRLERTDGRTVAKRYGEGTLKHLRYERGLDVR